MKSIQHFENQVNDVCLLMLIFYFIEIMYIIIVCTPLKKVKNAMILIRLFNFRDYVFNIHLYFNYFITCIII